MSSVHDDPLSLETGLFVRDTGHGPPVVMLHSSGLSGRQWRGLATLLEQRGMRCIVPDFTGQGASPLWPDSTPFSFRIDVERIATLLRAVGVADIVGHSYGGFVALQAALLVPDLVKSLTLFDPVAFGVLPDDDARQSLDDAFVEWGPETPTRLRWLKSFVEYWGGSGAWDAMSAQARDEFLRVGWVAREGARTLGLDTTPASAYRPFRFPVHLFTAQHSPKAARHVAFRLALSIEQASIQTVANAGHLAPVTHATLMNQLFLDGVSPQPPMEKPTSKP